MSARIRARSSAVTRCLIEQDQQSITEDEAPAGEFAREDDILLAARLHISQSRMIVTDPDHRPLTAFRIPRR